MSPLRSGRRERTKIPMNFWSSPFFEAKSKPVTLAFMFSLPPSPLLEGGGLLVSGG